MPRLEILPRKLPQGASDRIGRGVARLGITPNLISIIGFAGNVGAALLIGSGELLWAGVVYLFFSALDMVDGAVARATNQATPYGAVFDAVLDRASEAIVLGGCAWYFGARGEYIQAAVTYAAVLGSVAVSYMRARAEINGLFMREGIFRRQERVAVLGIGLLTGWLALAMWLLAVLSNLTAMQRFWLIARGLREGEAS
ncbi:MAG TPA: CDP-alcohol phosphatidyltransferase family protein [Tepidiformaceae bacterium]|nr:CDP-alcohol phosphatidyltransferase family protein [Tepidiformaceae bacterium]